MDEELLERVWRQYAGFISNYSRRRVGTTAADDIVVETFVVALRRPERIPDEPLAYLYAIAWRLIANHHRRERRRPIPLTAAHEPRTVDAYAEINLRSDLREALERLPARQAEAIRLVAFESLSASEAAVVLRCSPATFRVVLSRARRRLDALLGGELDEGP